MSKTPIRKGAQRKAKRKKQRKRKEYNEYLKSPEWKEIRQLVFRRDGHVCQVCNTNPATQVHHITYERFRNELLDDLLSVCAPCHSNLHPWQDEDSHKRVKPKKRRKSRVRVAFTFYREEEETKSVTDHRSLILDRYQKFQQLSRKA